MLTPNIPEAEILSGMTITDAAGMEAAARAISEKYGCAVLCKGGHQINDADDLLWQDGTGKWFRGKRIHNPNTHGTGCTLSSAIASNLAKGYDLDTSVERAKAYISGALAAMLDLGHGSGPMDHMFELKGEFVRVKKTSTFQNGLIWFGAGVSLAEILTGTSFAPLGMAKGFAAILIGHIIGCAHDAAGGPYRRAYRPQRHGDGQDELWPEGRPAVCLFECAAAGGLDGHHDLRRRTGRAAAFSTLAAGCGAWSSARLIILWIAVGITDLGWINKIAMAALFILTLVLCKVIFFSGNVDARCGR